MGNLWDSPEVEFIEPLDAQGLETRIGLPSNEWAKVLTFTLSALAALVALLFAQYVETAGGTVSVLVQIGLYGYAILSVLQVVAGCVLVLLCGRSIRRMRVLAWEYAGHKTLADWTRAAHANGGLMFITRVEGEFSSTTGRPTVAITMTNRGRLPVRLYRLQVVSAALAQVPIDGAPAEFARGFAPGLPVAPSGSVQFRTTLGTQSYLAESSLGAAQLDLLAVVVSLDAEDDRQVTLPPVTTAILRGSDATPPP